jgi:tetratricopeptide (TPR) repeat protein
MGDRRLSTLDRPCQNPNDSDEYARAGWAMSRGEQLDESMQSLSLPPGRAAGDFYDRAVAGHRARAEAVQDDPAEHAFRLWLLAFALSARAHLALRRSDLDEAIGLLRQAIELAPPEDPWLADYYASLGEAFSDRYERDHAAHDAESALAAAERSVELTPPRHPHLSRRLSQLGGHMRTTSMLLGRVPTGLTEALLIHRRALACALPGDPRMAAYRFQYAITLLGYAQAIGDGPALREANDILLDVMRTAHPYDSALPHYRLGFAAGRQLSRLSGR